MELGEGWLQERDSELTASRSSHVLCLLSGFNRHWRLQERLPSDDGGFQRRTRCGWSSVCACSGTAPSRK